MKTIRLLLMIALIAFCPARAYALEGWWDWLDALSGPGPYHGLGFGQTLLCKAESDNNFRTLCWREDAELRQVVEARVSWFIWDFGDQRFQDDPGDIRSVNAFAFDGFYLFRINDDLDIDIGPGMGFLRYSGEGFDPLYRFTFTPLSFSIAPFASRSQSQVARGFRLRLDAMVVPAGFTGGQFGNTVTSFRSGGEFLTRMAIVFRY
jgi:hypothetical protein